VAGLPVLMLRCLDLVECILGHYGCCPPVYGYPMVLNRNRTEAEDLVQETYIRALDAMGRLRENSNTNGWLFRNFAKSLLNALRRRRTPRVL
jgi:RNA polymerase sigma factor (sigma-70 family)